ncbi:hypothetical protein BDF20DRAFT_421550 [Mycotypha africana]|uniref:uncharacterized protein n=1 Tax=Mycotypha africana TaxID=64632 RepID=UPI00230065A2|nr:uncharacterized protein BDF20DRAFT_421550 [Mycotypha africana]KAI8981699.1 hypothetical protein BDF20DRAFT_421550 [Mycotypha africana]
MSSISNNKDLINLESLDDWLENDLRQSGIILPSTTTPCDQNIKPMPLPSPQSKPMTPAEVLMASPPISECTPNMGPVLDLITSPSLNFEPLSPLEASNAGSSVDTTAKPSVIDLHPFIKALTLLGTMQNLKNSNSLNNQDTINSAINNHIISNNINIQQSIATSTAAIDTTTSATVSEETAINSKKKRERDETLPDQQTAQQDLIALKRQRNTDAARRSRLRKALKMESLEKRVMDLEAENEQLKLRAAVAESERANIEAKEKSSRVRILELERQLTTTYKALVQYTTAKA